MHISTQGVHIHYSGDPLEDFTLMRFLDRFVYKNPKQKINDHGGSLMQRTSKLLQVQSKEMTSGCQGDRAGPGRGGGIG